MLSEKLAITIKKANENETASVEVMKFSLILLFNMFFTILLSLILAALFGTVRETVLALFSFMLLRIFSGGFHFKTATACTVASVAIVVIVPLIPITDQIAFYLTLAALILVLKFAPSNIRGTVRIPEKYFPFLKIISALIVSSNFLLSNHLLALIFFVQAVSLISKKEVLA